MVARILKVGDYKLVEKFIAKADEEICTVFFKKDKVGVYLHIDDALRHSGEWLGHGYAKYAVSMRKGNTTAIVHLIAKGEEMLRMQFKAKYSGWEILSYSEI